MPNFGDLLNIELCKALFDINPVKEWPEKCEASFIGSTLDSFLIHGPRFVYKRFREYYKLEPVNIWGSGFIMERDILSKIVSESFFRKVNVCAVRGSNSLQRINRIIRISNSDIVLADPGLLASDLYNNSAKRYKIGIIPHHVENDLDIFKTIHYRIKDSIIIDMRRNVFDVLKDISSCELIISSALHGLIVADSYNIPNIQLKVSNRLKGGMYKFSDYYSGYGIDDRRIISIDNIGSIDWEKIEDLIIDNYKVNHIDVKEKKSQLYRSFPY